MSHNTWIHKIARTVIVRPLVNTPVTPNHLTTLRVVAGFGAAACVAAGNAQLALVGAGLFVFSMLLDRADGDLARLTGRTSPGGHIYDLWADGLCNALIFVGLGAGLRDGAYGLWSVPMGLLAGGAVATVLFLVIRIESLKGARAAEISSFMGFDADDAMLAVPAAVALGWRDELLLAAVIGAPVFACLFAVLFRKALRAAAASEPT